MIPFEVVAEAVAGVPHMTRGQGRTIYEHVRTTGAQQILEIGCAHGVGACYMAAAIDGPGKVITVDRADFTQYRDPSPKEMFRRAGLEDRIELVLVEDSSYTWWLKDQVKARSDGQGNCSAFYDFCYIDGAHNLTIDGLAVILAEKLLKTGGWLLLDDLDWKYEIVSGEPWFEELHLHLSPAELREPHMMAVFDLIVRQHPAFTETRIQNGQWGWAHKDPTAIRRHEIVETNRLSARFHKSMKRARKLTASVVGQRER